MSDSLPGKAVQYGDEEKREDTIDYEEERGGGSYGSTPSANRSEQMFLTTGARTTGETLPDVENPAIVLAFSTESTDDKKARSMSLPVTHEATFEDPVVSHDMRSKSMPATFAIFSEPPDFRAGNKPLTLRKSQDPDRIDRNQQWFCSSIFVAVILFVIILPFLIWMIIALRDNS